MRGAKVTVVERSGIACAASGKAGGFLALDWCDGSPLAALARRSFALHDELASGLDDDWGHRRLETYAGAVHQGDDGHRSRLAWTSSSLEVKGRLGTTESTAQVNPAAFTNAMMQAAVRNGADLRIGEVTGLHFRDGAVTGVEIGDETHEGDAVVIAMGPWSMLATAWLPLPPVFGLKGHSVLFDTADAIPPEALFLEAADAVGSVLTPEVFPRADGTTYVCAISSEAPLPVDPGAVEPDEGAIDRLLDLCRRISPLFLVRARARDPGLLPPDHAGRPADHRSRAGGARRLCRDGPQRLGHPERARDRGGDGGADPRRRGAIGRSRSVRSATAAERSAAPDPPGSADASNGRALKSAGPCARPGRPESRRVIDGSWPSRSRPPFCSKPGRRRRGRPRHRTSSASSCGPRTADSTGWS